MAAKKIEAPSVMFLKFADNKVPEFKEVPSKDWVLFGEDNKFPDHLLYLFNKSSNHNAIINGKVTYILGSGLPLENQKLQKVNRYGENINNVLRKACMDIELNGGFYLEIIWNASGGVSDITHIPFGELRAAKNGKGFWHCKNWDWSKYKKVEPVFIPNLDVNNKKGAQIFCYKEYRPGCDVYPLPGYFGALNDIETDVEISKYNLSVIKQGMFSSKMITFNTGDPGEEAKKKLEKGFRDKFAGSDNAGRFMMVFNTDPAKKPIIDDLSTTDLDKLFDQLNKTTQAEIFSGHQVTSPMLFGIMEPGKLGGRNELQDAYEIFKNTYINEKQIALEGVLRFILPLLGVAEELKFIPVEPIGFKPTDAMIEKVAPNEWILEKAGIDLSKYPSTQASPGAVNENLKNLSGKQNQAMMRIVRQYVQGKINKEQATVLLKSSLGLQDMEIETLLSTDEEFSSQISEQDLIEMFEACGESRQSFAIVKSKPFKYESFAEIGQTDSNILDLIRKDKRITAEIIGKTLKLDPYYVESRISHLEDRGVLRPSVKTIGIDTIIEHTINPEKIDARVPAETVDVFIKYSYEPKTGLEPVIATTRPFCKRLIELDRLYTRAEIESITQRVGFSVWDRKGGFWGNKSECRHNWVRHIVIKKK